MNPDTPIHQVVRHYADLCWHDRLQRCTKCAEKGDAKGNDEWALARGRKDSTVQGARIRVFILEDFGILSSLEEGLW